MTKPEEQTLLHKMVSFKMDAMRKNAADPDGLDVLYNQSVGMIKFARAIKTIDDREFGNIYHTLYDLYSSLFSELIQKGVIKNETS